MELGLEFGQLLVLELGQECVFSAHWSWAWSWASCWSWELGQECVMSAHWSWAVELGQAWVLQWDPRGTWTSSVETPCDGTACLTSSHYKGECQGWGGPVE